MSELQYYAIFIKEKKRASYLKPTLWVLKQLINTILEQYIVDKCNTMSELDICGIFIKRADRVEQKDWLYSNHSLVNNFFKSWLQIIRSVSFWPTR